MYGPTQVKYRIGVIGLRLRCASYFYSVYVCDRMNNYPQKLQKGELVCVFMFAHARQPVERCIE